LLAPAINDEKVKRRRSFKDPVRIRLSIKRQTLGVKNAIDLVHNLNNKLKLKTNYVTNPEPKNNVNDEGFFTPKTRKAVDLEMIIENKCNELIIDIENYHLLKDKGNDHYSLFVDASNESYHFYTNDNRQYHIGNWIMRKLSKALYCPDKKNYYNKLPYTGKIQANYFDDDDEMNYSESNSHSSENLKKKNSSSINTTFDTYDDDDMNNDFSANNYNDFCDDNRMNTFMTNDLSIITVTGNESFLSDDDDDDNN